MLDRILHRSVTCRVSFRNRPWGGGGGGGELYEKEGWAMSVSEEEGRDCPADTIPHFINLNGIICKRGQAWRDGC